MKKLSYLLVGIFCITLVDNTFSNNQNIHGKSFYLGNNGTVTGNGLMLTIGKQRNDSEEDIHGHFWVQVEGGQTFKPDQIAQALFFNGSSSMSFGQSGASDVYSINFLLPQSAVGAAEAWQSTLNASPKISTLVGDFRGVFFFRNLKSWYVEIDLPLVYSRFNMHLTEQSGIQTTSTIPAGYIAPAATTTPYSNVINAFKGNLIAGQNLLTRQYGNIDGVQKKIAIGNTNFVFGCRLIDKEKGYLGVGFLALINGDFGGYSDAMYLGTPSVGTAGRSGIGVRIDEFYNFYEHDNLIIAAGLRADIVHTFNSTVLRSYDTKSNGVGSRYLLIKEFLPLTDRNGYFTYIDSISYAINITTLYANIKIPCVYDISLMLQTKYKQIDFDLGLQIHGHSSERHKNFINLFPYGLYGALVAGSADTVTHSHQLSPDISITGKTALGTTPVIEGATASTAKFDSIVLDINSALAKASVSCRLFTAFGYTLVHKNKPYFLVGASVDLPNCNSSPYQWELSTAAGLHF